MKFNREIFFREFKENLLNNKPLNQPLVNSLNLLLDQIEKDTYVKSIYHVSYMLATAWLETAYTMSPIKEKGGKAYFINNYWKKVRVRNQLGNKSEYDAWARSGRGYVQLTGLRNDTVMTSELKKNYAWLVEEFESRTGQVFNLVDNPEQALDPKLAYAIMTIGMTKGIFTGKKFTDYITNAKHSYNDYKEARRIINGVNENARIANFAIEFEKTLKMALVKDEQSSNVQEPSIEPVSPVEPIDAYPTEPKPGEAVPDSPADIGQPIAGGRPTDEPMVIPKEEPKETSGWGAWIANVRAQYASLGIGGLSLGSLSFLTNPLFIKIAVGFLIAAIVVSLIVFIVSMIIKAIEKRAREKEAHEINLKQLEIAANPALYTVVLEQPKKEKEIESTKSFLGFKYSA